MNIGLLSQALSLVSGPVLVCYDRLMNMATGLRWMNRVQSDLRQQHLDPKLAQNREGQRKAIMATDHGQG